MMRAFLLSLALISILASPGAAETVAEARALPLGTAVTLGPVTVLNVVDTISSGGSASFQVADETGAVTVFGTNAQIAPLLEGVVPGDRLLGLTGTIGTFNGLFQLVNSPTPLSRTGFEAGDGPPVPVEVSAADLQPGTASAEALESQLIVLRGVAFTQAGQTFGSSTANYPIESAGLAVTVRLATSDIASLFAGQPIPTGRVDIVGIMSQFDSSDPRDSGYQVLPVAFEAVTPSAFVDGAGGAVLRNVTPLSPYSQPGREVAIFEPGQVQNVAITFTGVSLGTLVGFEVDVPEEWGTFVKSQVALSGTAFAGAVAEVTGQTILITGAAVTEADAGVMTLTGLTPPVGEALSASGEYTFTVRSTVTDSTGSAAIGALPRAWVTIPIANLRAIDGDGRPLLLGQTVAVAGALTMEPFRLHLSRTEAFVQDDTGGVLIFSQRADFDVFFEIGAPLAALGRVTQFMGLTELEPVNATDIVELAGYVEIPLPTPLEVDLATLLVDAELYEGSLVTVPNLFIVSGTWPDTAANVTLVVSDGTAEIDLVALGANTELFDTAPVFPATVTGVVSQNSSADLLGGYRLLPRTLSDFEPGEVTVPPTAGDDAFTALAGYSYIFDILANDLVPAGVAVVEVDVVDSRWSVDPEGRLILFQATEPGEVVFTYTVFDSNDNTDTATVTVSVVAVPEIPPVINEFLANSPGVDTQEYIEIFGQPETDYSAFSLVVIEGDGTAAGTVDRIYPLGQTDTQGLWVTDFLNNELENGTQSIMLVLGLFGEPTDLLGQQWDAMSYIDVVDGVAVFDGGGTDTTYADVVFTSSFDGGSGTVVGASRIPDISWAGDITDWVRNDPAGAGLPGPDTEFAVAPRGLAYNTPGQPNEIEPNKDPLLLYADFRNDERYFDGADAIDDSISGPLADPDGDGLSNLLEFVLATDPSSPTTSPFTLTRTAEGWEVEFLWTAAADVFLYVDARLGLEGGEGGWAPVASFYDQDVFFESGLSIDYIATVGVEAGEPVPTYVVFLPETLGDQAFVRLRAENGFGGGVAGAKGTPRRR